MRGSSDYSRTSSSNTGADSRCQPCVLPRTCRISKTLHRERSNQKLDWMNSTQHHRCLGLAGSRSQEMSASTYFDVAIETRSKIKTEQGNTSWQEPHETLLNHLGSLGRFRLTTIGASFLKLPPMHITTYLPDTKCLAFSAKSENRVFSYSLMPKYQSATTKINK